MKAKNKKDEWDEINYDNLTDDENQLIRNARRNGYAEFYPMYPSWKDQGVNTLKGAKKYNQENI